MQINSVSSTNFGMAYRVASKSELAKGFQKITNPADWKAFNQARNTAINSLEKTAFAHINEYVNDSGDFCYELERWITYINPEICALDTEKTYETISDREAAVEKALIEEEELKNLDAMRREQFAEMEGNADHNSLN